jgi:hypothetical protein
MALPRRFRPALAWPLAWFLACGPSGTTRDGTVAPALAEAETVEARIDAERMAEALAWLASDDLRGRYTLAHEDIDRAASFLADAYRKAGIAPVGTDYVVPYDVVSGSEASEDLNVWLDASPEPHAFTEKEAVAIANGGGTPVVGEVALIGATGPAGRAEGRIAVVYPLTPDIDTVTSQAQRMVKAKAKAALLVVDELVDPQPLRAGLRAAAIPIPIALVARAAIEPRVPLDPAAKPNALPGVNVSLAARREDMKEKAPNVLAVIPGSDLAREIVLVGAHFDHIGTAERGHFCRTRTLEDGTIDGVCNGADDNGSGTAGLLELARAMADAGYRPRRSIVFAHFSGEELGLHGSHALAETPPAAAPFQGGEVVAMINMDMIGRLGAAGLSIGGLSSSDGWRALLDDAGDHGLSIVYERAVTSRSDHAHWYRKKVPVLFFFTGLHEDYHGPGDELDRINLEGMTQILSIALSVTMAAGDGAELKWTEPRTASEGEVGRLPGSDPATVEKKSQP